MDYSLFPPMQEIRNVATEEVVALGGKVHASFEDERRIYLKYLFPLVRDVRPNDTVQAGITVAAIDKDLLIAPFALRFVCQNGVIIPLASMSNRLERLSSWASHPQRVAFMSKLRQDIRDVSNGKRFLAIVDLMKSATIFTIDGPSELMCTISAYAEVQMENRYEKIMKRYEAEADRSRYGLMNAVTSVARDERDPDMQWRLEELGGGILVKRPSPIKPRPISARRMVPSGDQETFVGVI